MVDFKAGQNCDEEQNEDASTRLSGLGCLLQLCGLVPQPLNQAQNFLIRGFLHAGCAAQYPQVFPARSTHNRVLVVRAQTRMTVLQGRNEFHRSSFTISLLLQNSPSVFSKADSHYAQCI